MTRNRSIDPVAVVTGAAGGIGLATARWFRASGYQVVMLDLSEQTLASVPADLASDPDVLMLACNVSNPSQVQDAVAAVRARFGRLDALVNNAGVAVHKPIGETSFEEWRHVMSVNVDGAFLVSQASVPLMLETGGGAIVNVASISGLRASTLRVAYGTSKAALIHLTLQQAVELGTVGIRANAVAPGPVDTALTRMHHSPGTRGDYYQTIPMGRYGTVDEMANCIGFLCSASASFVNGQVLSVDGGFENAGVGLGSLRVTLGQPPA